MIILEWIYSFKYTFFLLHVRFCRHSRVSGPRDSALLILCVVAGTEISFEGVLLVEYCNEQNHDSLHP